MRLIEGLKSVIEEERLSFHMPGHKNGRWMSSYFSDWMKADVTEIPGTDNLHHPEGIILETQRSLAAFHCAQSSHLLVNGSTAGLLAAIGSFCDPGDELIVSRACHRAVYSALILGGLTAHYLVSRKESAAPALSPVSPESVAEMVRQHPRAKGVVLTSPNYHGVLSDLGRIARIVHDAGMILVVDEAHGAHLLLDDRLPQPALAAGADLVVHSYHKTLPALTQAAVLHRGSERVDENRLMQHLALVQSSSPSYLLMASVDGALNVMQTEGGARMDALLRSLADFRNRMASHPQLEVFDPSVHGWIGDPTRIVIHARARGSVDFEALDALLRETHGIQSEYHDRDCLVFITGIANEPGDFDRLARALEGAIPSKRVNDADCGTIEYEAPSAAMTIREAFYAPKDTCPLRKAEGRICGQPLIPYPPGIPVIVPGERVSETVIRTILQQRRTGTLIMGLDRGMMTVLKEEL